MPTIKDSLGREIVVYNHSESFDAFCEKIYSDLCRAFGIPEDLMKDVEWKMPDVNHLVSINDMIKCIDIFVSDDQEVIYKFLVI